MQIILSHAPLSWILDVTASTVIVLLEIKHQVTKQINSFGAPVLVKRMFKPRQRLCNRGCYSAGSTGWFPKWSLCKTENARADICLCGIKFQSSNSAFCTTRRAAICIVAGIRNKLFWHNRYKRASPANMLCIKTEIYSKIVAS